MTLKEKIYFNIAEKRGLEAYYLDTFLASFEDGKPRDNIPHLPDNLSNTQTRIEERLVAEGYLKIYGYDGGGFVITSKGKSLLERGGFRQELLYCYLTRISVWFSLAAFLMSIVAFIRTF
jgi:hypothetical protein